MARIVHSGGHDVKGVSAVTAIDFSRSFVTFFGRNDGNIARIQIDAACTLIDERTGARRAYYLIAPCRAEEVYVDSSLLVIPNYEFAGIFTEDECLLIRTHWRSDRDNREYGRTTERFDHVEIALRTNADAHPLADSAAILAATLANAPLVGQTEVRDEERGMRAVLEYPIKTMNVLRATAQYQVDTGPVLLPDFASTTPREIEQFDLAYILFHQFDQAEFILRKPVSIVPEEPRAVVTDYSIACTWQAHNTIFAAH
jgi:hypothetical protein